MNKETDFIVRYCRPTQCLNGVPCATAFHLRKKNTILNRPEDEKELSVNHFEFYSNDNYNNILRDMAKHGLQTKPDGCLAKIKYKALESDIFSQMKIMIDIIPDVDSHCLITNLYQNDIAAANCFIKNLEEVVCVKDV